MLATVTAKGQVTVPKAIRDRLNIQAGSQLDFKLNEDGSVSLRPLKRSALSIIGILRAPQRQAAVAPTVEQMTDAVADGAAERDRRSRLRCSQKASPKRIAPT